MLELVGVAVFLGFTCVVILMAVVFVEIYEAFRG